MIERLQDLLVVSDMDNTLLTARGGLPACNAAAIQLFCAMGGRFTVATGRPPESIQAALGGLRLSTPVVACGGAVLYDLERGKALSTSHLPRVSAEAAIQDVLGEFPEVGVEVMVGAGEVYVVKANRYTQAHLRDERLHCVVAPLEEIPDGWAKVVFAGDSGLLAKIQAFALRRSYSGAYFLSTNSIYFELMPQGVSKATGMAQLCERLGISMNNTIFIGDYYNDLELMRAAGHSVAVANAPLDVQAQADEVTWGRCVDGGVGEYLYRLCKEYT